MTLRALRDLPNQEGFRFVGVDLHMVEHDCIVDKNPVGCHSVYREADREPFFFRLYGWKRHDESISQKETK